MGVYKEIPLLIIAGKGRSGSTLLQFMLDAHPEVCAPLESRFFLLFQKRYGSQLIEDRNHLMKQLRVDLDFDPKIKAFWDLDLHVLENQIRSLPAQAGFGELMKAVYQSCRSPFPRTELQLLVDKNPIHAYYLPALEKHFPQAKYLHLVRDPRANLASVLKFDPRTNLVLQAQKWVHMNRLVREHESKHTENFMSLKYEDLIAAHEKHLSAICSFCGVNYDPQMGRYYETLGQYNQEFVAQAPSPELRKVRERTSDLMHRNVSGAPNPQLTDAWKQRLTEEQIALIEALCGKEMKRYNYERLTSGERSPAIAAQVKYGVSNLKRRLYFNLPHGIKKQMLPPKVKSVEIARQNND